MNTYRPWLKTFLLLLAALITGCAASSPTVHSPQSTVVETLAEQEVTRIECPLAYDQGCRHQGRIFPWGAWVDIMGYDSTDYEIKQIDRRGTKATVLITPR